jgi:alpha-tubulin suppressor-like RCC1 family protein
MSLISKGQTLISNIELGSLKQEVPFEIHSDYTGEQTLTDSRQLRLNIKPSENTLSNTYVNMGIDNQYGNQFYISCPVTDATISGDKAFVIDDSRKVIIQDPNIISQTLSAEKSFVEDIYVKDYIQNGIISVNGTLLLQTNLYTSLEWVTVSNISCGPSHTLILTPTGDVYAAGSNEYGQLGIENYNENLNTFTRLLDPETGDYLTNVKLISCVDISSFYVTNENKLYGFGSNEFGQLGLSDQTTLTYSTPQLVNGTFSSNIIQIAKNNDGWDRNFLTLVLTEEGRIYYAGIYSRYGFIPYPNPINTNIKKIIYSGERYWQMIKNDGTAYYIDGNRNIIQYGDYVIGSINVQIPNTTITQISCDYHTLALDSTGNVWVTGSNGIGSLGLGDTDDRSTFTLLPDISNVTQINVGPSTSLIVSDGQLYACGLGNEADEIPYSALGVGDDVYKTTFTACPGINDATIFDYSRRLGQSVILRTGGAAWITGAYYDTVTEQYLYSNTYISLGGVASSGVVHIEQYNTAFIITKNDGTVYAYGTSFPNGRFGYYSTDTEEIWGMQLTYQGSPITDAVKTRMFSDNSFIFRSDGSIIASGKNTSNCFATGVVNDIYYAYTEFFSSFQPGITDIYYNYLTYFLLKSDGTIYENNESSSTYFLMTGGPPASNIVSVSTRAANSFFILTDDGQLYRKGNNTNGSLGIGNEDIQTSFNNVGELLDTPFYVKDINYNVLLLEDGSIGNYISKFSFEPVSGYSSSDVVEINGNGSFTIIKKTDNKLYTNEGGVFTLLYDTDNPLQFDCGQFNVMIINSLGQVLGKGTNYDGNLGIGNYLDKDDLTYYSLLGNPEKITLLHKTLGDYFATYSFNGVHSNLIIKNQDYKTIFYVNGSNPVSILRDGTMIADMFTPFTGYHFGKINGSIDLGLIVSVIPSDVKIKTQKVKLSNMQMDCNVIGVMSGKNTFNSLGEGGIWVSDINGTISSGDYITSSILPGYGQKQDSDFMENYTVAKIIENCFFDEDYNLRFLSLSEDKLSLEIISKEKYLLNPDKYYRAKFVGCTYHCG